MNFYKYFREFKFFSFNLIGILIAIVLFFIGINFFLSKEYKIELKNINRIHATIDTIALVKNYDSGGRESGYSALYIRVNKVYENFYLNSVFKPMYVSIKDKYKKNDTICLSVYKNVNTHRYEIASIGCKGEVLSIEEYKKYMQNSKIAGFFIIPFSLILLYLAVRMIKKVKK